MNQKLLLASGASMTTAQSPVRHLPLLLALHFSVGLIPQVHLHADVLSRSDAVRMVLERNPEVEAARNAWEGARARARLDRALPDPEFEFEELPRVGLHDHGEHTIGVSQRVEFPLKWWHRFRAGRRQAEAARLALFETAKLDLGMRAKRAYDRIALQKSLLGHARQDLELAREVLRQATIRFEAGDVPQLDVMRARVEAGRATNRLTAAENDLTAAKTELNALLARPLQTPYAIADSLVHQPFEADLDQLTEAALQQRPDLTGIALQLKALKNRQAAATAAYFPDLNLGLALQQRHGGHGEDSWLFRLEMEVPLWAFSRQRGERAEARAAVARIEAEREALRFQVLLETEQAYLDLGTAGQQVVLFQDRILPEAERAFAVAGRSYKEGKSSYLELLETRRTWIETQVEYAGVLFEYRAAEAALERAIGSPLPARSPAEN